MNDSIRRLLLFTGLPGLFLLWILSMLEHTTGVRVVGVALLAVLLVSVVSWLRAEYTAELPASPRVRAELARQVVPERVRMSALVRQELAETPGLMWALLLGAGVPGAVAALLGVLHPVVPYL